MKAYEIIANADLRPVAKGRMSRLGWYAGYLVVEYPPSKSAPATQYIMGPDIPEAQRDKLLRVPYPDSLLQQLKTKHGWKTYKSGAGGNVQRSIDRVPCPRCDGSGCTLCGRGVE